MWNTGSCWGRLLSGAVQSILRWLTTHRRSTIQKRVSSDSVVRSNARSRLSSDIVNVALSADSTLAVPAGLVAVQIAASAVEERGAELAVARQPVGLERRRRTVAQQDPVLLAALDDAPLHGAARGRPDKGHAVVLAARHLARSTRVVNTWLTRSEQCVNT